VASHEFNGRRRNVPFPKHELLRIFSHYLLLSSVYHLLHPHKDKRKEVYVDFVIWILKLHWNLLAIENFEERHNNIIIIY